MATFKQYDTKQGTRFMFKAYLGIDSKTGKRIETTRRGFQSKKEAKLALNRLQLQFENGEFGKPVEQSKTFLDVFLVWKENYELTVKESTFVKAISQYEVHVIPVFGDKKIDEITVLDIQKFANEKVKKFVKYRDFITDISRIFEYAISIGIVKENPAKRITIPKRKDFVGQEKRINYYTAAELKEFLDCSKNQQPFYIYTFFMLLSASGCRQGELLGLEWRSVDFVNKCIYINQTLARGKNKRLYLEQPKTRHSKRSVSLDENTIVILKHWQKRQKEYLLQFGHKTNESNQLVFSSTDNSFIQLSKPRTWMLQTINKNSLREITIHGFRHTHATLLLEAGVEPKTISERLGHSSIQITLDLYSHVTEQMEKKVPDIFSKVMENI